MSEPITLKIKEFNPELIRPNNNFLNDNDHKGMKITIIGKPGTGKTSLITYLLYLKRNIFPIGLVMSGTEDSNGHYKRIFPDSFIYNKLDQEVLTNFINRQRLAIRYLKNPWGVVLLDDCTDDPKIFSKPLMQGIFKNGRHWKMLFILSLQYCMDIKPVIRTNIDGTFILRESNLRNRKSLWENYAGVIPDFNMFCEILDCLTEDHHALYIDNSTKSNKIEDCVYWWKPPTVDSYINSFKFGSPDYWNFHNARYNTDYIDPII